jgi:hypothetical protein
VVAPKKIVAIKPAMTKQVVLSEQAVDRILSDIGAKMTAPVKERFLRCLVVCADWYSDAILYNHGGPQKNQREYLVQLRTAIPELLRFLNVDATPPNLRGFLPVLAPFLDLRIELKELETKLARVAELRSDTNPRSGEENDFVDALIYQDHFKERSPFDWLAGVYLPEVCYLFLNLDLDGDRAGNI